MTVPRDHWHDVVTHFDELTLRRPGIKPLASLVQEIAMSKFAAALHPWISTHDLCLARAAQAVPEESPHLRLGLLSDAAIEFRYVDSALDSHQWRRVEPVELAFGRLLIFFDQLNWFGPEPDRR